VKAKVQARVRVALIRPGTTDFDEQQRIQGDLDVPLNAHGREEVEQIADELRDLSPEAIYYGTGEPCASAAAAIARRSGCKVKSVRDLRNANLGLWQGLKQEDIRRKHPRVYRQWHESPATICPPDGESLPDAFQRACKAVSALLKKHRKGETIGIVVSEPMASLVRCCLNNEDLTDLRESATPDGSWEIVQVERE
jgi:broad specificity phosphatase PhoE